MCLAMPCVNVSCCALKADIWLDCDNQSNTLTSSAARLLHPSAIARLLAHSVLSECASCSLKVVWEAIEHSTVMFVRVSAIRDSPAESIRASIETKATACTDASTLMRAKSTGRPASSEVPSQSIGVCSEVSDILSVRQFDKMERPTRSHSKVLLEGLGDSAGIWSLNHISPFRQMCQVRSHNGLIRTRSRSMEWHGLCPLRETLCLSPSNGLITFSISLLFLRMKAE
ncbi:hypothetical protein KC354_g159 [Hortaea werneckii]|nr:hypothetical protein KC354_g159 [Hortaea werneckii]